MSRTYKISQLALWTEGRVVKTAKEAHGGECFLCDKGKRPKRALSKARRRQLKKALKLEENSG